jgi:hypothetical protein
VVFPAQNELFRKAQSVKRLFSFFLVSVEKHRAKGKKRTKFITLLSHIFATFFPTKTVQNVHTVTKESRIVCFVACNGVIRNFPLGFAIFRAFDVTRRNFSRAHNLIGKVNNNDRFNPLATSCSLQSSFLPLLNYFSSAIIPREQKVSARHHPIALLHE